jgi:hypothetical protein
MIKKAGNYGEQALDTTVFTTSFYYPPELQTSQVVTEALQEQEEILTGIEAVFTEARMMPNPVRNMLNISYKLTRPATVWFSVHSSSGVPAVQTSPQNQPEGNNSASVNMSHLLTGNYTVYVHVDDMVLQRVVIKK